MGMLGRILGTAATLAAVLASAPAAEASLWSGTCAVNVTFTFSSPVRSPDPTTLTVTRPSYSISVAPAADLNPLTSASEPCAVTLSGVDPFRETSVSASGTSTLWTCQATRAGGSWTQSWGGSPPAVSGSHAIVGGPDGWTMVVHNSPSLTFVGTMELVVHPGDTAKLAQCALGGITSLTMTGVMVFQDP